MNKSNLDAHATAPLHSPFQLGPYALRNRTVMAPLTRNRAGVGNTPTELNALYYAQRASAGLIITEATQISPQGQGYPGTPGIYSDAQVDGWKRITQRVHEQGGRIFLQLWHVGRISHPSLQPDGALPVAPSALKPSGETMTDAGLKPFVTPRALETHELPDIVAQYRHAASMALTAGFDGVEIHAANGYLLDQFLRDGTNRRTDDYGGSVQNRTRLLLEVTEAVSDVWGAERVGVRISPVNPFNDISDCNPQDTFEYVVAQLNGFHLSYLHVVEGAIGDGREPDLTFDFGALRARFEGTYIANGGYDKRRADQALARQHADLVAFGVLYLANPDLPQRFALDAPLNDANPATFYGGGAEGYTDYPFLETQAA